MKSPVYCLFVSLLIAAPFTVSLPAQPIGVDAEFQGEILTRGPVHEAFAAVVTYNPEAGMIIDRAPPEPIEEMPPEERPVDADTAWIPGYWGWDDERNDFIWISGTWRVLPPGRAWIGGYWRETGRGWQWVTGYWEDAERREVVYLSPPPESLERGPSSPQPTPNHAWVPGNWDWMDGRYLWRPGYWMEGRADWVWVPSYYIWTPRGHVFVDGYWDYAPAERGLLFAPVYYAEHRRPRSYYRPTIVLNVAILSDYLFLRPRYSHYYFGDYYDSRYEGAGFYATFSYQSSRRGYDPFYSYSRWRNRDDRDWDRRYRESYDYRRSHVDARPPRTWSGSTIMVNVNQNINITQVNQGSRDARSITYAQPIQQYARSNDAPVRVERSASRNFDQQVQVARQVQEQRTQRRSMESQPSGASSAGPSQFSRDTQIGVSSRQQSTLSAQSAVALPTSPIVAREGSGRRQPPPRAQSTRREEAIQDRRVERQQPDQRGQRDVVQEQTTIGSTPAPASRYEAPRGPDRGLRADNSAAVEAQRLEDQAQREEQRQAQEAARRNSQQAQEQVRSQQQVIGQQGQGRDRADERRAVEAQERAAQRQEQQSRQVEPITDEQLRRDQERQAQQRGQERQAQQQRADERYQQAEAQQQAREQQGRAIEQERAQQRRAAEQQQQAQAMEQERAQQSRAAEAQAREQQARAVEQERAQQNRAAEQAREQQARVAEQQQAREQQARAAEQEGAQQAQAAEQERARQARAAEQVREQQARAAQQAEAAKQKASPNRDQKQPPKKSKEELEEEERQKRKGGSE